MLRSPKSPGFSQKRDDKSGQKTPSTDAKGTEKRLLSPSTLFFSHHRPSQPQSGPLTPAQIFFSSPVDSKSTPVVSPETTPTPSEESPCYRLSDMRGRVEMGNEKRPWADSLSSPNLKPDEDCKKRRAFKEDSNYRVQSEHADALPPGLSPHPKETLPAHRTIIRHGRHSRHGGRVPQDSEVSDWKWPVIPRPRILIIDTRAGGQRVENTGLYGAMGNRADLESVDNETEAAVAMRTPHRVTIILGCAIAKWTFEFFMELRDWVEKGGTLIFSPYSGDQHDSITSEAVNLLFRDTFNLPWSCGPLKTSSVSPHESFETHAIPQAFSQASPQAFSRASSENCIDSTFRFLRVPDIHALYVSNTAEKLAPKDDFEIRESVVAVTSVREGSVRYIGGQNIFETSEAEVRNWVFLLAELLVSQLESVAQEYFTSFDELAVHVIARSFRFVAPNQFFSDVMNRMREDEYHQSPAYRTKVRMEMAKHKRYLLAKERKKSTNQRAWEARQRQLEAKSEVKKPSAKDNEVKKPSPLISERLCSIVEWLRDVEWRLRLDYARTRNAELSYPTPKSEGESEGDGKVKE